MAKNKRTEERRQHPRYPAKKGTITVNDKVSGQIIDISMGGLAFSYVEREDWSGDGEGHGMLMGDAELCIEDVPLKVISDCAINSGVSVIRRCGVKFEKLTPRQLSQLEYFIWTNTTGQNREEEEFFPEEE